MDRQEVINYLNDIFVDSQGICDWRGSVANLFIVKIEKAEKEAKLSLLTSLEYDMGGKYKGLFKRYRAQLGGDMVGEEIEDTTNKITLSKTEFEAKINKVKREAVQDFINEYLLEESDIIIKKESTYARF